MKKKEEGFNSRSVVTFKYLLEVNFMDIKSNNFITLNYYIIIRKKQRCRVPEKSRSSLLWVNFLAWF